MKPILFFLSLTGFFYSAGQVMPADSIVLSVIYGRTDVGGKTYSRNTDIDSQEKLLTYAVVFKRFEPLNNQSYLVVIVQADGSTQHGHQLGYREFYFLQFTKKHWHVVDSVVSEYEHPLGDVKEFDIINIGKKKKALVSVFQSTGNHHFEKVLHFDLLEPGRLTYLLSIDTEYDNGAWAAPESDRDSCEAIHTTETYALEESNSEMYIIRVDHTEYAFSAGCAEEHIKNKTSRIYTFNGKKYEEEPVHR